MTIVVLAWSASILSAIPPEIADQMHDNIRILEISTRNLDQLWRLEDEDGIADIIEINLPRTALESAQASILMNWVSDGHTLWLIGDYFRADDGPDGDHLESLFGITVAGTVREQRILGTPGSRHPVLTGVQEVELSMRLSNQWHGRVAWAAYGSGFDSSLLEADGRAIAVIKAFGVGHVVCLPQIEIDSVDGERFILNLREWSAGYSVPGAAPSERDDAAAVSHPGPADADLVTLRNGDVVSGTVLNDTFTLRTSYAAITFEARELLAISIEGSGEAMDRVVLRVGDRLSGEVQDEIVRLRMQSGTEIEIDRDRIASVTFGTE